MDKVLLISDVIISSVSNTLDFIYTGNSYELALKIYNEVEQTSTPLVINLNSCPAQNNKDNPINLIHFLRCFGKPNPIIALGQEFELTELLQFNPENIILTSPGTTYKRLGFPFLTEKDIPKEITNEFSAVRQFLKQSSSVSEIRHEEANWWGVYRLMNIHKILFPNEMDFQKNTPDWLLNRLNSKNGVVARFLNSPSFVSSNPTTVTEIDSKALSSFPKFGSLKTKIINAREKLKELNPKIIYIDDMAHNGWSQILQQMIYGKQSSKEKPNKNFEVIVPNKSKPIAEFAEEIAVKAEVFNPDCILLDLRLLNETGVRYDIENLSGSIVLKQLKKKLNKLPVILFTASNKIYTYKKVKELGCDALLEKEGIDDKLNMQDALFIYKEMIDTFYEFVSFHQNIANRKIYEAEKALNKIDERFTQFKNKQSPNKFYNVKREFDFDICIIDSNVFLEHEKINKNYPAIKLLGSIYRYNYFRRSDQTKMKSKFILTDVVYNELVRLGKSGLNEKIRKTKLNESEVNLITNSRWALNCVQNFLNDAILWGGDLKTKAYHQASYADDYFIQDIIPKELKKGKSVLFISNDVDCKNKIVEKIKTEGLSSSLYRSMFSRQMVAGLKPILEQLIS